jgi:hypothetical protein
LYYSGTDSDLEQPSISPNNFLRFSNRIVGSSGNIEVVNYKRQWRICQQLTDEFWKIWQKWYDDQKPIRKNSLVLIMDNNIERNEWKKGIVVDTFPGKDGRIRSALVRTSIGVFTRPVSNLAVVNLSAEK